MMMLQGQAQLVCWLLITTGGRIQDLMRMKRAQLVFRSLKDVAQLEVHFRYTKNRRSEKTQWVLKIALVDEIPIPNGVVALLKATPEKAALISVDASNFNKAIDALGPAYAEYTSYSFRRLFVHRAIDRFRDDDDYIAWSEVMKLTGHVQVETLRTSYAKKGDRTL